MSFRFTALCTLLLLALLSGCGGLPAQKEAAPSPKQGTKSNTAITAEQAVDFHDQLRAFHKWNEYWIPFVSEYNGAIIEMESIGSQLISKHNSEEMQARIEKIPTKLKKAEHYLNQLPAADGLSKEHCDLLDQHAAKARSALVTVQEMPALLSALVINPNDSKTAQALANKLTEANEILTYNEHIIKVRDDLIKRQSHPLPQ